MTNNDTTDPEVAGPDEPQQGSARRNRGIRFSDSEWEEVRAAAQDRGVTPAEFVREKILDLVRNPASSSSVAIPADLAPLIERTFRYTYMVATKMRNDMMDAGDAEALDQLVAEARALQESLVGRPAS